MTSTFQRFRYRKTALLLLIDYMLGCVVVSRRWHSLKMDRKVVSEELSRFFGVLAHPLRVLIIEELRNGELTVTDLKDALMVPQASVSQHLGILRANRIVLERREGRHVFYHLRQPELSELVVECISFISPDNSESQRISSAIDSARSTWEEGRPSRKQVKRNRNR